jgi:uncharacterized membrane protein
MSSSSSITDKLINLKNDYTFVTSQMMILAVGFLGVMLLADAIKSVINKYIRKDSTSIFTKILIALIVIFIFCLLPQFNNEILKIDQSGKHMSNYARF